MGRGRHAILGRPLADLFRNISFANDPRETVAVCLVERNNWTSRARQRIGVNDSERTVG
jgi:hypothetical protein